MIRSSKLSLKFMNTNKRDRYNEFLLDYNHAVQFYINYLWNTEITRNIKDKQYKWYPSKQMYELPTMLSTTDIQIDTPLSARALKCAITQSIGIIQSVVRKYNKKKYVLTKKQKSNTQSIRKLQSFIDKNQPTKPLINKIEMELNSIVAKLVDNKTKFDCLLKLSCLGKKYGTIIIPIKYTTHSNKLSNMGQVKTSFLFGNNAVSFRYDIEPIHNTSNVIVGGDIGQTTTLTLSDGNITKPNNHGYDLKLINNIMARKKKGSKAFARCQAHRTNYINWSIKQLNLGNYKEIRLESNKNIKKGRRMSKSLTHWSWKDINNSITMNAELHDVHVVMQHPTYKSQRCNCCGYVHKGNRKSKLFKCRHCGYTADADLNGALNNSIDLPIISRTFMAEKHNTIGFFWNTTGISLSGEARTVPLTKKHKPIQG